MRNNLAVKAFAFLKGDGPARGGASGRRVRQMSEHEHETVYRALGAIIEYVAQQGADSPGQMTMSFRREGQFKQPAEVRDLRRPLEALAEASLTRAVTIEEFDAVLREEPGLPIPSHLKAAVHDAIRNWRIGR